MPSLRHTLFAILCVFFFNLSAYALPLSDRQVNGSQTLETVTTEMTPDGPVTATCTIVLTPVTDANGQAAVEEVKTCKLVLNPSPSQSTPPTTPVETSSQTSPGTTLSTTSTADGTTSNAATITSSPSPPGGSGAVSAHPVSSVTVSSSSESVSSSSSEAVSAQPVSTVTPITSTAVSSPTSTSSSPVTSSTSAQSTSDIPTTPAAAAANTSDASTATTAASSTASGTTAAADSSNAAINLPGKKLSVLPIGLGVFAGISVIALIVVGLVTYERRKYRKAFRQRKLAESGAAMGYGGMAQTL